jgi:hypothetical protein
MEWVPGNLSPTRPEARLGKLVQLPKRGRITRTRSQSAGTGEVVLFTGIRYERQGSDLPDKPAGAATGGKRRRG